MGRGERSDVGRRGADHWTGIQVYAETMWTTEGCKQFFLIYYTLSSGVHVQIMKDCHIGVHMPWWFAASIPASPTLGISPVISPQSSHPLLSIS